VPPDQGRAPSAQEQDANAYETTINEVLMNVNMSHPFADDDRQSHPKGQRNNCARWIESGNDTWNNNFNWFGFEGPGRNTATD